jgi:superfamily II DNA or RNA helicase
MTETVGIKQHDATYIKILCSESVKNELYERFSFMAPNAKFDKRVKMKLWNGMISLYNKRNSTIMAGLKFLVIEFCQGLGYEVIDGVAPVIPTVVTDEHIDKLITAIKLNPKFEVRDYQRKGLKIVAEDRSGLLVAATNSGKSLMAYLIFRWFNKKTLLIVPTITLVGQMAGDFRNYGYDGEIAQITAGVSKQNLPDITTATWQSLYTMPKEWFKQFEVIIGDEAHTFSPNANAVKSILEKSSATIRIGMSGSLEDAKLNMLTYQGLFGKIHRLIGNKEMQDRGFSSKLNIVVIVLQHPEEVRKQFAKLKPAYPTEIEYILKSDARNKFIAKLAKKMPANTLTLFKFVEHGKLIYKSLAENNEQNAHLVYSKVDADDRNAIRAICETKTNQDIIASFRTFATGISITNLYNMIFAHPMKSKITILQAMGRMLRKGGEKDEATLYDIVDDLTWKSSQNHTYRHYLQRLELYEQEQQDYKIINISL